jgi:hypothetical protein
MATAARGASVCGVYEKGDMETYDVIGVYHNIADAYIERVKDAELGYCSRLEYHDHFRIRELSKPDLFEVLDTVDHVLTNVLGNRKVSCEVNLY